MQSKHILSQIKSLLDIKAQVEEQLKTIENDTDKAKIQVWLDSIVDIIGLLVKDVNEADAITDKSFSDLIKEIRRLNENNELLRRIKELTEKWPTVPRYTPSPITFSYKCPNCGAYIQNGAPHVCYYYNPTTTGGTIMMTDSSFTTTCTGVSIEGNLNVDGAVTVTGRLSGKTPTGMKG